MAARPRDWNFHGGGTTPPPYVSRHPGGREETPWRFPGGSLRPLKAAPHGAICIQIVFSSVYW